MIQPPTTRTQLARRSSDGLHVTLVWVHQDPEDSTVVCVCDTRDGSYFEIPAEPHLALDVYYHPFAYRDFSTVDCRAAWPERRQRTGGVAP